MGVRHDGGEVQDPATDLQAAQDVALARRRGCAGVVLAVVQSDAVVAVRHVRVAWTGPMEGSEFARGWAAVALLLPGAHARLWAVLMSLTFFSTPSEAVPLVSFTVYGKPEPQGSVRAFVPTYKNGEPMRRAGGQIVVNLTSDNPALKAWRKTATQTITAQMVIDNAARTASPVRVEATFYLQRPKHHHGTGRNADTVKASAPAHPVGRPDVDKLLRALLDALTGTVVADDSQVVQASARKCYCGPHDEPRVEVSVFALAPQG